MQNPKLYVGNLNYRITDEDLSELFGNFGEVAEVKIIVDRETGRSKGFGFVEMSTIEEAEKAAEELDGQEYEGRTLRVNEARPQRDKPRRDNRRY